MFDWADILLTFLAGWNMGLGVHFLSKNQKAYGWGLIAVSLFWMLKYLLIVLRVM